MNNGFMYGLIALNFMFAGWNGFMAVVTPSTLSLALAIFNGFFGVLLINSLFRQDQ